MCDVAIAGDTYFWLAGTKRKVFAEACSWGIYRCVCSDGTVEVSDAW